MWIKEEPGLLYLQIGFSCERTESRGGSESLWGGEKHDGDEVKRTLLSSHARCPL